MSSFPFPIEINPAISTLVENAQRANPHLGKATTEQKKQKLKSQDAMRSTASQTDSTALSDDLLGDMDPDQFKGKDRTAEFKKKMQEWIEDWEKEEEKEKEKREQEAGEQEKRDQGEGKSTEDGMKEERAAEIPDKGLAKGEQTIDEKGVGINTKEITEIKAKEEVYPKGELTTKDAPGTDKTGKEVVETQASAVDSLDTILKKIPPQEKAGKDSIEFTAERDSKKTKEPTVLSDQPSSYVSLITYDDGFIIADTSKKRKLVLGAEPDSHDGLADKETKIKETKRTPTALDQRLKDVFDQLIIARKKGKTYENLCGKLKRFGIRVLELCRSNSERVLLIPEGESLEDYANLLSHDYDSSVKRIRYGYFPKEKLMVIGEEIIKNPHPKICIPILYFAHVFDHALGDEGFASEKSPAVIASYKACKNREHGRQFIDSYSAISPVHYFAQTVEAFLTAPHGQLIGDGTDNDNLLCTKEELYDLDRPMYSYIEYLFRQVNRGEELNSTEDYDMDFGVI